MFIKLPKNKEMTVARIGDKEADNKFVGKILITKVYDKCAIASVLPEPKSGRPVQVGDLVYFAEEPKKEEPKKEETKPAAVKDAVKATPAAADKATKAEPAKAKDEEPGMVEEKEEEEGTEVKEKKPAGKKDGDAELDEDDFADFEEELDV